MTQGSGTILFTEGSKSGTLLQEPAFMEQRETSQSKRVWRILYSTRAQNHESHTYKINNFYSMSESDVMTRSKSVSEAS